MPRHKAYERDEVINKAMLLFWAEGFDTASIPKLEQHLGINRYSIYDSFGSKRDLFFKALESYTGTLVDTFVGPLESGSRGLSDLKRFFAQLQKFFMRQEVPRGCLLCNTAIELGNRDQEIANWVERYFDRVEKAIFNGLLRALELDEIKGDPSLFQTRALLTRSSLQGMLVDLRLGRNVRDIQRTFNAIKSFCTNGSFD